MLFRDDGWVLQPPDRRKGDQSMTVSLSGFRHKEKLRLYIYIYHFKVILYILNMHMHTCFVGII